MSLQWIQETPPQWDASKQTIVGGAPAGIFNVRQYKVGDLIPGEWWRVEEDGTVVGYGWMDCTWGDAEILLVVDRGKQRCGIGTFILEHLEREARARGLNYLYNVVPDRHPDREAISTWLKKRRFDPAEGGRLMRHVVQREGRSG